MSDSAGTSLSQPSRPRRGRLRGLLIYLGVMTAMTLLMAEVGARLLTGSSETTGVPTIGRFALLPYRPDPQLVRDWLQRTADSTYYMKDPELGWTAVRGGKSPDGMYMTNAQGVRVAEPHEYPVDPPPGVTRIIAMGDSFTHGDMVRNDQTWAYHLDKSSDTLEVMNFGIGGYGTDQAFLRWRKEASRFRSQFVMLGVWPENICRNLNVLRYYLQPAGGFTVKPRFVLENGSLEVVHSPVLAGDDLVAALTHPEAAEVLRHDYWATPDDYTDHWYYGSRLIRAIATAADLYERKAMRDRLYSGEDPAGIDITVAIADQFAREVAAAGSTPLILLIPMRDLLEAYPDDDSLPLVKSLRAKGLTVIDMGPPVVRLVRERGMETIYLPDGHFTPEGNRLFAERLAEKLKPLFAR